MTKVFLKNFQVNGAALPDAVVDAILAESTRDLEAAKANPGASGESGGKTFTQEDVNRIVSERLAHERAKGEPSKEDAREQALLQREARLDCRDYLAAKNYPADLMDLLDSTDVEKFKATVDAFVERFPAAFTETPAAPPYSAGAGTQNVTGFDPIANAFKIN